MRPRAISHKEFEDRWDKIFARKKTPKQGLTKRHKDKTKYDRNTTKKKTLEEVAKNS
jgi:hypothetical protein